MDAGQQYNAAVGTGDDGDAMDAALQHQARVRGDFGPNPSAQGLRSGVAPPYLYGTPGQYYHNDT